MGDLWPSQEEVAEIITEGQGFWKSCSGCHETNEGHPTGPIHPVLRCAVGFGCTDCGGIGAVWDTTDYGAMCEELALPAAPAEDIGILRARVEDQSTEIARLTRIIQMQPPAIKPAASAEDVRAGVQMADLSMATLLKQARDDALKEAASVADTLHYPDGTKISASIRDAILALIPGAKP